MSAATSSQATRPGAKPKRVSLWLAAGGYGVFLWGAVLTSAMHPSGLPMPSPQFHGTIADVARVLSRNATVALLMVFSVHLTPRMPALARGVVVGVSICVVLLPAALAGVLAGQPGGMRYFAHAPLELAALALAAGWATSHATTGALEAASRRRAVLVFVLLAVAAIVEVAAAPHVRI